MPKVCDHTSVGLEVWKEENGLRKLLFIERRKYPFGYALPAGHADNDKNYETAAIRELEEEVGLQAANLMLVYEGRKENPCRREGGTWHYWKIYEAKVLDTLVRPSIDETKGFLWISIDEIRGLAIKTEAYLKKEIIEEEWEKAPGLEPVWYELLRELKVL